MTTVLIACDVADGAEVRRRLAELCRSADRDLALAAMQANVHVLENAGDVSAAVEAAERALTMSREDEGPWVVTIMHAELANLAMQLGDRRRAVGHARIALPVLSRLGATDDETQLRALLLVSALADGDLDTAEAELAELTRIYDSEAVLGGVAIVSLCAAELALARGEPVAALAEYRLAVQRAYDRRLPRVPCTELTPWTIITVSVTLTAYAYHAPPEEVRYGEELFATIRGYDLLTPRNPVLDYPVCGSMIFSLGAWGLLRGAVAPRDAVRLLVLAERFAYNSSMPCMAFARIEPYAEEAAPGMIAAVRAEYGDRRGPDLLDEARGLVERLRP
jgi:tetratricopeptide (TPR) repeat protein